MDYWGAYFYFSFKVLWNNEMPTLAIDFCIDEAMKCYVLMKYCSVLLASTADLWINTLFTSTAYLCIDEVVQSLRLL